MERSRLGGAYLLPQMCFRSCYAILILIRTINDNWSLLSEKIDIFVNKKDITILNLFSGSGTILNLLKEIDYKYIECWDENEEKVNLLKLLIPTTTYFRVMSISTYGVTQSFCYYLIRYQSFCCKILKIK